MISFSTLAFMSFIHVLMYDKSLFHIDLLYEYNTIHSTIDGSVGYFQFLTNTSRCSCELSCTSFGLHIYTFLWVCNMEWSHGSCVSLALGENAEKFPQLLLPLYTPISSTCEFQLVTSFLTSLSFQ